MLYKISITPPNSKNHDIQYIFLQMGDFLLSKHLTTILTLRLFHTGQKPIYNIMYFH